jgi:tetratricopeptide (TPR) repeat protein
VALLPASEGHAPLSRSDPKSLNAAAWYLATLPDGKVRDAARGVELAETAVKLAPDLGNIWNTLGVAHYYAGNYQAAIEALNKSVELRHGGDSTDWFFLAMAEWQLGNKDAARKWYDKAIDWMDNNDPTNEELIRFRAEAAELLSGSQPAADRSPPVVEATQPNDEEIP